jgi:hypothetical protein
MEKSTKFKGDVGVAAIISCLTKQGIHIALPISEHLPFDIIAINKDKLSRLSIKYITKRPDGTLYIPLRTISSNSNGYKIKFIDMDSIDGFGVYCPDNDICYFINKSEILNQKTAFVIRIDPPINPSSKSTIHWASNYTDPFNILK